MRRSKGRVLYALIFLVIVKWIVGPKSVRIDGQQLRLVVVEKESHGRSVGGFHWGDVSLTAAAINEREHWRFVPSYVPRPRFERARERDQESRSRSFFPAET